MLARILLSIALALASTAGPADTGAWRRIEAPRATTWPRDHGAHLEYRTEWWYATGELATAAGERFGVELTLFRQGVDSAPLAEGQSPLRAKHVYAGHLVVIELATGRVLLAERVRRGTPGLAEASTEDLDVRLEGWSLARAGEELQLVARDAERGIALDLAARPSKALVLHGTDGVSRKGAAAGNASLYASWTRMAASGAIEIGGRKLEARGELWFDHEWGTTALGEGVVGWDWFGLRLDDGRELMLYRLRRADGSADPASAVTLVAEDGSARSLPLARFTFEARSTWTSPRTEAAYPASWRVACPEEGLELVITPRVSDCELDTRASTGVVYWEGPVAVTGSVTGGGYGELTGYATALPHDLGGGATKK